MICVNHPEREGQLTVQSTLGDRYMCDECRSALVLTFGGYKSKREAWQGFESFGGRGQFDTSNRFLNPNHIYTSERDE